MPSERDNSQPSFSGFGTAVGLFHLSQDSADPSPCYLVLCLYPLRERVGCIHLAVLVSLPLFLLAERGLYAC